MDFTEVGSRQNHNNPNLLVHPLQAKLNLVLQFMHCYVCIYLGSARILKGYFLVAILPLRFEEKMKMLLLLLLLLLI